MIAEYDAGTDDLLRLYVYGPGIDEPLLIFDYTVATPQVYYYHYDALGNIVALSDNNGDIVERYGYDAYGNVSIHTSAGANGMWMDPDDDVAYASAKGNPYLFTGRRYDEQTGLYYCRARYYSPELGRFISADPIGYLGGLNLYSYCGNNPINWIDPYGLLPWQLYNQKRSREMLESISKLPTTDDPWYSEEHVKEMQAIYYDDAEAYYGAFRHHYSACLLFRKWGYLAYIPVLGQDYVEYHYSSRDMYNDIYAQHEGLRDAAKYPCVECLELALRAYPNEGDFYESHPLHRHRFEYKEEDKKEEDKKKG